MADMTRTRAALLSSASVRAFASAPSMATTVEAVDIARQRLADGVTGVDADTLLRRAPDSAAMLDYWDQTDAIVEGHAALKAAGKKYLPSFDGESSGEYKARLGYTKYTNIYRDVIEALANKPFEKEVKIDDSASSDMLKFAEDVDGAGNNLTMFAAQTFFDGINSAVDWIFVDFAKRDPTVITQADAKARGIRPFWSHVLGRNVLEARVEMITGQETLTYVRIFEPGSPDKVRVIERLGQGTVQWTLYEKMDKSVDGKTMFAQTDQDLFTIGIIPLVPFATGRRDGRTFKYRPAMRDAADLQIQLYQDESGLKWAKTLTAYPMLTANGVKPQTNPDGSVKEVRVGPNRILYAPPDGNGNSGSWSYIEPTSQSLKFLADDIKETIQQLRELGRQPLTAQSGNLTVVTTAVAAGKARSAVQAWALGLKDALENALKITGMWFGSAEEPTVEVFTEFPDGSDNSADVAALGTARKDRDLSQETYWDELQRRGILSDEFDPEVERERLLNETPADPEETPVENG
jgi:hypothetical protein